VRRLAPVALALLLSTAVSAQQTPNVAKGFNAETTYDFTNLEAVNLFNGSVTMSVPIGQTYTVGPTLSYRFTLVYTGNNWIGEQNTWHQVVNQEYVPQTLSYNEPYGTIGVANDGHAGLGWHFSMGHLVSKAKYIAPDGSHHDFANYLPAPGVTASATDTNANVLYSTDGTYMRLRHQYALNGAYTGAEIDFPDGSVHRFDAQGRIMEMRDSLPATNGVYPNRVWFTHTTSNGSKTGITAVDSLGRTHTFKFERMASVPGQGALDPEWGEFADLGKTEEPDHYDVLTEAKLAAFDGTQATYTFYYIDGNTGNTGRDAAPISRKVGEGNEDCQVPPVTHVPLLQSINLPDGLSYNMTYDRGNMIDFSDPFVAEGTVAPAGVRFIKVTNGGSGYVNPPTITITGGGGGSGAGGVAVVENGVVTKILTQGNGTGYTSAPTVVITPNGSGSGATAVASICGRYGSFSGNVVSVQLPTLGSVDWTYQNWHFPPGWVGRWCDSGTGLRGPCGLTPSHSVGVATRLSRAEDGTVMTKRTYASERRAVGGSGPDFHSQITTVKEYEGFDSQGVGGTPASTVLNYYSNGTDQFPQTTLARPGEYGLPFTRYPDEETDPAKHVDNPDSSTPGQPERFLSSKTFDKNGVLRRTTYVAYENNMQTVDRDEYSNRRLRDESVLYNDDDTWILTRRTDATGLGQYKTVTRSSNIPGTPTRVSFTNYTLSASGGYDPATLPSPWITNAYTSTSVTEGGRVIKTDYCFDGQFLTRKRFIRDNVTGTPSGTDVVVTYEYDLPRKNLIAENYHGGDTFNTTDVAVGSGALCTLSQLGTRDYRIEHKPVNPSTNDWTETSKYFGASSFLTRDVTVDKNTGAVAESRDTAGVSTVFKYDAMGRNTSVRPTGRAWTAYWYPISGIRKLSVEQHPEGVTSSQTPLSRSLYDFDSLGRVVKETKLMPGNATSVRTTTYDDLGRKKTVSEFVAEGTSSPPKTELSYDAEGRISTSLAPDGSLTSYTYVGATSKTRVSGIWTGVDGNTGVSGVQDTSVAVTEQYDAYGRLVAVEEKSGPTSASNPIGGTVRTEYTYDPGDKLLTVTMKAPSVGSAAGPVQRRLFDYDGRGFLRWESQPEAGMTSYLYDARGHVLSMSKAGAQSQSDLEYVYDAAERVVTVKGRNPESTTPAFRVLKTFEYGTANLTIWDGTTTDKIKGKLRKATRYNYVGDIGNYIPTLYKIEDQYTYPDAAGRMTVRQTTILDEEDEVLKTFDLMTVYNDLDLPVTFFYPMCEGCGYPGQAVDRSADTRTYDRGRLKSVANFVNNITYWPNGMRNVMPHVNGIADTQTVGNMARPSSIKFATYDRCVKPSFSVQPGNKTSQSSGAAVTLTASATGAGTITYDWYDDIGNGVGTNATITVYPTQTTDYYVIATNSCGYTESQTVTVTIATCQPPSTGQITPITQPDRSWVLTPDPSATANRQYQWRQLPSTTVIGTQETLAVASVSQTTTFKLTIIDDCGEASSTVTLSVPLSAPSSGLVATATSNYSQITVTWPAVSGATSYELQRRSGADWETLDDTVSTTTYVDTTVAGSRTYAYRVKLGTSYSNADVASTMTFAQAVAGQQIDTIGPNDMLLAVNKVRAAAGWPAVTWQTILSPSDPVVASGSTITARQILSCRARMNEARQALGAPAVGYTDQTLEYQSIKAAYINEVQQGAQ
jgi:hypothetical protein